MDDEELELGSRTPYDRAKEHPGSRQRAIVAMCYRCMGEAPGWRNAVRRCTDTFCPLYSFRPGSSKEE